MSLQISVEWAGHGWPLALEPDDRDALHATFRSAFGPKAALIDELREERGVPEDATVVVRYDGVAAYFHAGGHIRQAIER